jgi:hypothetical protein
VLDAFGAFEMGDAEGTVKEDGPDLLFFKHTIFFIPHKDLIRKTVVNIFKDKQDLVERGAKGIINLRIGLLQVEHIIIFGSKLSRELEKSLLKGFFRGIGVLFNKVQGMRGGFLIDFADR